MAKATATARDSESKPAKKRFKDDGSMKDEGKTRQQEQQLVLKRPK